MKTKFVMLMLAATLVTTAHASKTVLPDSCGADKVKFDVDSKKDAPAPSGPAEGKAQIIFIETLNRPSTALAVFGGPHVPDYVTRFGMDGAWVGAAKANSYFAVDVAPGEHHLCTSVKGSKDLIGMDSLTTEAGKTYYVEYKITPTISSGHVSGVTSSGNTVSGNSNSVSISADINKLNDETGKFRVKASVLSVSKPSE
jgi:hypothetical protein